MSAQPAEVTFDAESRRVTVRVAADSLTPEIKAAVRPSRLEGFEDGVRQHDVAVDIEHAPLTLAVLIAMGGRSHELSEMLEAEAPYLVAPLLERLGRDDRVVLSWSDSVCTTC